MKKNFKNLFISLFTTTLAVSLMVLAKVNTTSKVSAAKAEETYSFVEQNYGLDFVTSANNATVRLAVNNYAVQEGDYLALDIEGNKNKHGEVVFKAGLNGGLVSTGADWTALPALSRTNGWTCSLKYTYWLFATDGRGIVYYKLSEYFPNVTTIESLDILFSDNKLESFTLHNAFITNDVTARNGTSVLNVFDGSGNLINEKVTNVSGVAITARNTAKGFQTNKTMAGAVSITMPKTHIEINLDGTVNSDGGGYLAYDINKSRAQFAYFRLALKNSSDVSFNADYYENGKSLSKNGTMNYSDLTTTYGYYFTEVAASGTVLERLPTSAGFLSKIIIDCDNLFDGEIALSNFYFISSDFSQISLLVDLANMSAADRATNINVSCTAQGFAMAFNRCAFYCDSNGVNKPTFNNINADTKWSWALLAEQYDNLLSDDEKQILVSGSASTTGNDVEQALARYDYIVGKYLIAGRDTSFTDFLGRNPAAVYFIGMHNFALQQVEADTVFVIAVTTLSIMLIGLFFILLKKKKER